MALADTLASSFGSGGFDLASSIGGIGDLFGGVTLPTLELNSSGSPDLAGFSTDGVLASLGDLEGVVGGSLDGFPDVPTLLGPLESVLSVLDLLSGTDLAALEAQIEAALRPEDASLAGLLSATSGIAGIPLLHGLLDGVSALGLDVRSPASLVGGAAGGVLALVQLLGALMGVEATSSEIQRRIDLAAELLAAHHLAALADRVGATGGASLAGLLRGVDADDPGVVEIVCAPIEAYAGAVRELVSAMTRGIAFAEATLVHADLDSLVVQLTVATAALQEQALVPVRALVESAAPVVRQIASLEIPPVGPESLVQASAGLAGQLHAVVDDVAPASIAGLLHPILDPVLAPVRAVNGVVEDVQTAVAAAFDPIHQALSGIDLTPLEHALEAITAPVQDAIDALQAVLATSQGAVQTAVQGVLDVLAPLQDALIAARDAIASPFADVHNALAALDLASLHASLEQIVGSVADAVSSAPIRPVFDVASGAITTAADALSLVPRSILPDDLKAELDEACATVQAIDLAPTRTLLHAELQEILAELDASALDAVQAGYQAVEQFVASIDPEPLAAELDAGSFGALKADLAALDPAVLLAEPLAALDAVRGALDGIDIVTLIAPLEEVLDDVRSTIAALDPAALLAPLEEALSSVRSTVTDALHLDDWTARLDALDVSVASFVERFDPTGPLADLQARWTALLAPLRETGPSLAGSLLGGLLGPSAGLAAAGGLPEVLSWIRGERNGAEVVRGRLTIAAETSAAAASQLAALDLTALSGEIAASYAALTDAVSGLPAASLLRQRLDVTLVAGDPRAELAVVRANVGRVVDRFREAAAVAAGTTPPDRSEVSVVAHGLATAFTPFAPALETGRRLLAGVGVVSSSTTLGTALADALEEIGPGPIVTPFAAVVQSILGRITELVHEGVVVPLQEGVDELRTLIGALSVDTLLGGVTQVRADLLALVDAVRPTTILSAPLATFESLRTTLHTLDPLAPVRIAIDTLRATVDQFAAEFAPSVLLRPVVVVYGDVAALVGAFDVAGLLEPVLTALHDAGSQLDGGMDEVIDALEKLQAACGSDGGALPGVSVAVGGGIGL